jgi:polar amino acid transport system substrate-binding protein
MIKQNKWYLYRHLILVVLVIIVLFPAKLLANNNILFHNEGEIRQLSLATGEKYFPFIDVNLPNNGWSSSVIKAVFKELKVKTNIGVFPWSRVLLYTKIHKYDGAFPYISSKERRNDFYFSEPINYVPIKIVARDSVKVTTITDLTKYTFCLPYGYELPTALLDVIGLQKTTTASTIHECLNKVIQGWGDIVLFNKYSQTLVQLPYSKVKILDIKVPMEKLYFIVSKKHPQGKAIISLFNQGLQAIKNNGTLESINKEFESLLLDNG